LIREGFEDGAGAIRAGFEQEREGVFHRGVAEIVLARVAVDAVEKRGEIQEFVARFDELEIEDFLLARHVGRFGARLPPVNGEEAGFSIPPPRLMV
jgi:hypothetical protein